MKDGSKVEQASSLFIHRQDACATLDWDDLSTSINLLSGELQPIAVSLPDQGNLFLTVRFIINRISAQAVDNVLPISPKATFATLLEFSPKLSNPFHCNFYL